MIRKNFAAYLRQRQLTRSPELSRKVGMRQVDFERIVQRLSDQAIIDSYRICSQCGGEMATMEEADHIIAALDDPDHILDAITNGHGHVARINKKA